VSDELVEIVSYALKLEAELVVRRLEAAGIDAITSSDGAGGALPPLTLGTGGYRVMVRADEADSAVALLADAENETG